MAARGGGACQVTRGKVNAGGKSGWGHAIGGQCNRVGFDAGWKNQLTLSLNSGSLVEGEVGGEEVDALGGDELGHGGWMWF
jgi:hypothetical protein